MENKQSFYGGGSKSFYGVINSYGDINNLYEEKTITGPVNIASFNDGLKNKKIKQLIVAVEPQQDFHGYDNPWPAGGGKNLFDIEKATLSTGAYGFSMSRVGDKVTVSGTATSNGNLAFAVTTNYADYSLSGKGYVCQVFDWSGNKTLGGCWGFRTENEKSFAISLLNVTVGDNVNVSFRMSVAETSQASYSPYSNVCPISGFTAARVTRTGKNLLDDTGIDVSAGNLKWSIATATGNGILLKKGATYTVSCNGTGTVSGIYLYKKNTNTNPLKVVYNNTSLTYTPTEDVEVGFNFYWTNSSRPSDATHIMLELGSTATSYEPYSGNTHSISWQTEAGTVYGGSLDVTTGVLTVDRIYALLNDASAWYEVSGNPKFRCSTAFADRKKYNNSYDGLSACSYIQINALEYTNTGRWVSSSSDNFGIESSDLTLAQIQQDATEGKIAIVYELATPVAYQLTPTEIKTLLGENNVWADTGPVEKLVYIAKKE